MVWLDPNPNRALAGEYRLPDQQLREDTANAPHVHLWTVLLAAKQQLGRS